MNFSDLKIEFTEYLISQGIISEKEYFYKDNTASVFMYAQEFKDYLHNELKCDTSIYQESIFDILEMQVIDGKLVNPDEVEQQDSDDSEAGLGQVIEGDDFSSSDLDINSTSETEQNLQIGETDDNSEISITTDENVSAQASDVDKNSKANNDVSLLIQNELEANTEENQLLVEIFNDLIKDEKFLSVIDLDSSGDLSSDELTNFFNTVKDFDSDGSNVSLDDMLQAIEKINDGTFELLSDAIESNDEIEETEEMHPNNQVSATGGSGGGGGGGNYNTTPQEKTLDNMTKEELNAELSKAQTDYDEKKSVVDSILDGSNPELKELENNIDTAYELFQSELKNVDEEMAQNLDTLKKSIEAKEDEIDKAEQNIINQEVVVSEAQNAYDNAVATRQVLESTLSSLQQVDTSELDSSQKSEIAEKISTVQTKIEEAKEAEDAANTTLENEQENLEELKEQKEQLKTGEGGLDELNEQMTELQNQIEEKYPEIKQYMDDYNAAKENYETEKEAALSAAKADMEKSLEYVNKVQSAINNSDNRDLAMKYSFDGLTELTRKAVELAYTQIGVSETEGNNKGDNEKYGAGEGVAWCAAFVSWLYDNAQGNSGNNPLNFTAGVSSLRDQAKAAGYYSEVGTYTPKPGDIMIQKSQGASHTGIVVKVEGNTIYTIEGNADNAVRMREYTVGESKYGRISGWIRMSEWSADVN